MAINGFCALNFINKYIYFITDSSTHQKSDYCKRDIKFKFILEKNERKEKMSGMKSRPIE